MVRDRIGAATSAASPRAGEVRALNRARLTLAQWLPRRYAACGPNSPVLTELWVTTLRADTVDPWPLRFSGRGRPASTSVKPGIRAAGPKTAQRPQCRRSIFQHRPSGRITYRADARHSTPPARALGLPCLPVQQCLDHQAGGHSSGKTQRSIPFINVSTSQRR